MPRALAPVSAAEIKALSALNPISQPSIPFAPIPVGYSPQSTLAIADDHFSVPQHRPELSPPKNFMLKIIQSYQKTEHLDEKSLEVFEGWTSLLSRQRDAYSAELQKIREEAQEVTESQSSWHTLSVLAQTIVSVGSILAGYELGDVGGALLIACGALGLTEVAVTETGLGDYLKASLGWFTKSAELQETIAQQIAMSFFVLQMGLGLAGGALSWQNGMAIARASDATEWTQRAVQVAKKSHLFTKPVLSFGEKVYQKKGYDLQALQQKLNGDIEQNSQEKAEVIQHMEQMAEASASFIERMRAMIQTLTVPLD